MSNHQYDREGPDGEGIPRFEPWLRVLASSLIPAILALYLHSRFLIPSIVATVLLFVGGLVMLRRDAVRRRVQEQKHLLPAARSVARPLDVEPLELERL